MAKRTARVPAFSRLGRGVSTNKKAYKQKRARANRRRLHQSKDIREHTDKRLNSWDID